MAAPPPPPARPGHPGALRAWLTWWALLAALWLALVDTVTAPELITGAGAAAVAASGAVGVRSRRRVLGRAPRPAWLFVAARALGRAVTDLWPLGLALWRAAVLRRAVTGRLTEMPYAAVGDDPGETAHRAWTEALGSLAPNTVVVDVDARSQTMLVHQLVPTPDPRSAAQPLPEP